MDDYRKTKAQLIEEINYLRRKIASESRIGMARPPRVDFEAGIELKSEFDTIYAKGINLSQNGICFEIEKPLLFSLRFEFEDKTHTRRAGLVWAKKIPENKYRFGLQFAD